MIGVADVRSLSLLWSAVEVSDGGSNRRRRVMYMRRKSSRAAELKRKERYRAPAMSVMSDMNDVVRRSRMN